MKYQRIEDIAYAIVNNSDRAEPNMTSPGQHQENPGNTLYVSNIYENISIDGMYTTKNAMCVPLYPKTYHKNVFCSLPVSADTVDALRTMFSRYGAILDIIVRSTYKLRGQAWVVFENPGDASRAVQGLDGFHFMKKPIKIVHATSKSDAIAKLDGTYSEEKVEIRRQQRRDAWERHQKEEKERQKGGLSARQKQKRKSQTMAKCTILVENIPLEANEGMLLLVFQRFSGLKEVRMLNGGSAHVEYDYEEGAAAAIAGLQGFKLATDKPMKLTLL